MVLCAVKPISPSQRIDGFRVHCGPSRGDRRRRDGEIGFTAQRSHLSVARDLVALFPLLAEADRTTAAQYAIGARLEVGVDVIHIWRDVGITGKALHH